MRSVETSDFTKRRPPTPPPLRASSCLTVFRRNSASLISSRLLLDAGRQLQHLDQPGADPRRVVQLDRLGKPALAVLLDHTAKKLAELGIFVR